MFLVAYSDGYWTWAGVSTHALEAFQRGFELATGLMREHCQVFIWPKDKQEILECLRDELGAADQRAALCVALEINKEMLDGDRGR